MGPLRKHIRASVRQIQAKAPSPSHFRVWRLQMRAPMGQWQLQDGWPLHRCITKGSPVIVSQCIANPPGLAVIIESIATW